MNNIDPEEIIEIEKSIDNKFIAEMHLDGLSQNAAIWRIFAVAEDVHRVYIIRSCQNTRLEHHIESLSNLVFVLDKYKYIAKEVVAIIRKSFYNDIASGDHMVPGDSYTQAARFFFN